jgi:hypothetical protein
LGSSAVLRGGGLTFLRTVPGCALKFGVLDEVMVPRGAAPGLGRAIQAMSIISEAAVVKLFGPRTSCHSLK